MESHWSKEANGALPGLCGKHSLNYFPVGHFFPLFIGDHVT
jgi:hypothetical protein